MRRCIFLLLSLSPGVAVAAEPGHWAWQKPRDVKPPAVKNKDWVRNPVDAFLLAELEKAGLSPAKPADKETLLRRVTFDLTGLPPTPDERAAFLADDKPDAYARVVERLLASPHFGERWAQHWLDAVRYAESNGYEVNLDRPHAWRYRDYVVKSFNDDKPYDRFLTEQLAGDILATGKEPRAAQELLTATGFNRCGQLHVVSGNIDPAEARQEVLNEFTSGVGNVFLGLTVQCARCHDHKFDPISQKDYYQLEAFFAAAQLKDVDIATAEEKAEFKRVADPLQAKIADRKRRIAAIDAPYRARIEKEKTDRLEQRYKDVLTIDPAKRTIEQLKLVAEAKILTKVTWDEVVAALTPEDRVQRSRLRGELHEMNASLPAPTAQVWAIGDGASTPPTYVLKRGEIKRKDEQVQAAFPAVFQAQGKEKLDRLALAKWLTDPDHPLTARVMVNRVWQHHFGRGLVSTPNDFGTRGGKPTHPDLLDWLAREFVRRKWSVKEMHRLMVLSSAYQQASGVRDEKAEKIDPDNRLLWRMNRRRLEAEALRDAALATAGTLNPKLGGPPVRVPLEPEVYDLIFTEDEPDGLWATTPDAREHTRRSLYLFNKRNVRLPLLEAFDQPDTLNSCPVRPVSTFAPQALILLNGPFMQEQSAAFAARVLRAGKGDDAALIERAYLLAFDRRPTERELRFNREFLAEQSELIRDRLRARKPVNVPPGIGDATDPALAAALADLCLALLNSNEFVYLK